MNMIRPVSDLRNNFADISKTVHETAQPVFLTKNGYGDMVVLSMEAFENLQFERSSLNQSWQVSKRIFPPSPHWTRSTRSRRQSVFHCSRQAYFSGSSRPASIGAQSFPVIPRNLFRSLFGACTLGFSTSGSHRAGRDANRQFWQFGSSRSARFRSSW